MNLVGHVIKMSEKSKLNGHVIKSNENLEAFQKI